MFLIHDSFELALNITAFIPCLLLIIIYIIDFKELKFQNYFKFEMMIALLFNISLNFVKNYNYNNNNDEIKCNNTQLEIIGLIKSYLDILTLFFLASFTYLCYIILKNKNKDDKKCFITILSIINWILPSYIFILYYLYIRNKNNEDNKKYFISISGKCIFNLKIKQNIHLYLIPSLFIIDAFFYIMIVILLNIQKKNEKEDDKIDYYNDKIKRISINFISHFLFFVSQYINMTFLFFDLFKNERDLYYNINYNLSLTILCLFCLIDYKIREYWQKLIDFLKFEKEEKNDTDTDLEPDDLDNDEDIVMYKDKNDSNGNDNNDNNTSNKD